MELTDRVITGCTQKIGDLHTSAKANEKIKINIADIEVLKVTCPHGKKWAINITVDIVETDA